MPQNPSLVSFSWTRTPHKEAGATLPLGWSLGGPCVCFLTYWNNGPALFCPVWCSLRFGIPYGVGATSTLWRRLLSWCFHANQRQEVLEILKTLQPNVADSRGPDGLENHPNYWCLSEPNLVFWNLFPQSLCAHHLPLHMSWKSLASFPLVWRGANLESEVMWGNSFWLLVSH